MKRRGAKPPRGGKGRGSSRSEANSGRKPGDRPTRRERRLARDAAPESGAPDRGGASSGAPVPWKRVQEPASAPSTTPYTSPQSPTGLLRGTLRVLTRGDAIVLPDDPLEAKVGEIFVARDDLGGGLHGDRVEVQVFAPAGPGESRPGTVVGVRTRSMRRVAGTVRRLGRDFFLDPDDPRVPGPVRLQPPTPNQHILLPETEREEEEPTLPVVGGEVVLAEILRYPTVGRAGTPAIEGMLARVVRLLDKDSLLAEEEALLAVHGLPAGFSDLVVGAARQMPATVRPIDRAGRADLTSLPLVTIDPWDARDHDDAIALRESDDDVDRVVVAIADVSYYVVSGSPLDREARERATSVYFPDRVVSMLPLELSANICSLVEDQERLALVAELDIDAAGAVLRARFYDAVMRSHGSLTYEQVQEALDATRGWQARAGRAVQHADDLRRLDVIAQRLHRHRMRRGAMDLDIPEAEILWDREAQRVRGIRRRPRSSSHRLVEEFMLAANESVARFFRRREAPAIYRIHEPPDPEKLLAFAEVASALGHPILVKEQIRPADLAVFLETLQGKPEARSIHRMLLRAMKQARYDLAPVGHFGLAATNYLHFTSPIRRYPDLAVHRRLREELSIPFNWQSPGEGRHPVGEERLATRGGGGAEHAARVADLAEAALQSSYRERRSMEAERDVDDLYRCAAALAHQGEDREGIISSVTGFGFFVEIDDPFLEGLVPIASLRGDYFEVSGNGARLVGVRTGYLFSLGDRVKVRIADVSLPRRRIDFALLEHDAAEARGRGRGAEASEGDRPASRRAAGAGAARDGGRDKSARGRGRTGGGGRERKGGGRAGRGGRGRGRGR